MSKPDFEFKLMEGKDIPALMAMYKLCLNPEITENYFTWKYTDNPAGTAIGFVAYDKQQIAGFYGVIPELFMIGGKSHTVYQSMDTMTHPDYQKLGLFTALAKKTYAYLIEQFGPVYLYGVAGPTSVNGFVQKLDWKLAYHAPYVFLNKRIFRLGSLFRSNKNVLVTETRFSSPDFDYNFDQTHVVPIRPKLSKAFLIWRVEKNTDRKYHVLSVQDRQTGSTKGWCVLSLDPEARCKIEHLEAGGGWGSTHFNALFDFIFRSYPVQFVYTWRPAQKDRGRLYRRQGFLENPFSSGPFSYRLPFIVYSNSRIIEGLDWFEKNNFDVQPLIQD
jgi:GNAT superfamily N-acetyltransferase